MYILIFKNFEARTVITFCFKRGFDNIETEYMLDCLYDTIIKHDTFSYTQKTTTQVVLYTVRFSQSAQFLSTTASRQSRQRQPIPSLF